MPNVMAALPNTGGALIANCSLTGQHPGLVHQLLLQGNLGEELVADYLQNHSLRSSLLPLSVINLLRLVEIFHISLQIFLTKCSQI